MSFYNLTPDLPRSKETESDNRNRQATLSVSSDRGKSHILSILTDRHRFLYIDASRIETRPDTLQTDATTGAARNFHDYTNVVKETDGRKDGRTDTPTYAYSHLKTP